MIKRLKRHGNSFVLLIDKPICELLGIDPSVDLQIKLTPDAQGLEIRKKPIAVEDCIISANEMGVSKTTKEDIKKRWKSFINE